MPRPRTDRQDRRCAYVLCGELLPVEHTANPRVKYCDAACYRNAKQWRWRHRKPALVAQQRRRRAARRVAALGKAVTARRRAAHLAELERLKLAKLDKNPALTDQEISHQTREA